MGITSSSRSSSSVHREKFESGVIVLWLHQFDTCALANGWLDTDKLCKLPVPAFLRGRAVMYYYSLHDEQNNHTMTLHPISQNLSAEFEQRTLQLGEDPTVFLWELTQPL